jgi:glycine oxidase
MNDALVKNGVDVAVVGGGAIGCSIAYHAAARGARVALFEAERLGMGSSGALAGMLSGQAEAEKPGPYRDLMIRGREYQRNFASALHEVTGLDTGHVWDGALRTATDDATCEQLLKERSWNEKGNLPYEWLNGREVRKLELALSAEIVAGLYLPEDGQVNPRVLVQALATGAALKGTKILEFTHVMGFTVEEKRLTGVRTTKGEVSAKAVVLAGGAFSSVPLQQLGFALPLYPVKGQMLVTNMWPSPIKANVWDSGNFYVVPKKDGRMIVGATEELGVHDPRPTLGGVAELSRVAINLIPSLSEASFVECWGGLRSASSNRAGSYAKPPNDPEPASCLLRFTISLTVVFEMPRRSAARRCEYPGSLHDRGRIVR